MTQDETESDATPRIGLELGRQIFDKSNGGHRKDHPASVGEESIRRRAYKIWENEGRAGDPHDHWYRAERELNTNQPEQSSATAENAPPVAVAGAKAAVSQRPAGEGGAPKKPRRKRTS